MTPVFTNNTVHSAASSAADVTHAAASGSAPDSALSHFVDRIRDASATGQALCIQGGGSKHWYGQAPRGDLLDTRAYSGIIDYDPTELVMTARCGTPLSEIVAALTDQGQMLPFEPPSFTDKATIGGVVAAGLAGPRRAYTGSVRDFLLGSVLLTGRAERLTFGGQVMKNVAGYDVSRLLAGSMGCLGLLLDLSIKVLPLPRAELSLQFAFSRKEALEKLNTWAGLPYPISGSCWEDDRLTIRLSGAEVAIGATRRKLGGELLDSTRAELVWRNLREQTHPFFNQGGNVWRLSVPDTAPEFSVESASELIEWGGAQRWFALPAAETEAEANSQADTMRTMASRLGGHATLFRRAENSRIFNHKPLGVFHPLTPPLLAIHRRLQQVFDPAGIFNPGRMYPELDIQLNSEGHPELNSRLSTTEAHVTPPSKMNA